MALTCIAIPSSKDLEGGGLMAKRYGRGTA